MSEDNRISPWMKGLHIILAALSVACGIYVLVERKLIIAGKYFGDLYHLGPLESVLIALSFFLLALFLLTLLSKTSTMKNISEALLIGVIALFMASAFV